MFKLIIFLTFLAFTAENAHSVVGYEPGPIPLDHPASFNMVALVRKEKLPGKYRVFCSGSIASSRLILSAKHCLVGENIDDLYVYFGDDTSEVDEKLLRKVIDMRTYGNLKIELTFPSFDFGWLKIDRDIPEGKHKQIKILTDPLKLRLASRYSLAGFGISEETPRLVFGIKRYVDTTVKTYISNMQFVSMLVLEGEDGRGGCHGDSGGPVFGKIYNPALDSFNWYLLGLSSGFDSILTPKSYKLIDVKDKEYASDCGGGQSIYTFVGDYVNWSERTSLESLNYDEKSLVDEPGKLSSLVDISNTSQYTFNDWCKKTSFVDPEWLTVRQLLLFASQAESIYPKDEVILNCQLAEEVLQSLNKIRFTEDDSFLSLAPIKSLKNLKSLEFIKTVIPNLKPLVNTGIKNLKLHSMGITNINKVKGLSSLTQLESLYLTDNNLSNIDGIEKFVNLKELDIGLNEIHNIENLSQLINLQYLGIYGNKITDITPTFQLVKMREFVATSNLIESLTNKLANWPNLEIALFNSNNLININFLRNSKKIKKLRVLGNPIQGK